ncbi:hypothetical protein PInf_006408 [Phytophthora infestans]|nr:hypothetical protein PInf_006408 [Phytophthora infestans]
MAKLTGSTDYKLSEVQLPTLVEKFLSLGKDEWERLAISYNSNRGRSISERDYESLRRKFKMLYSTRKPTGVADMPPHIKETKLLKKNIDEKAGVTEMDDGADVDGQFEDEEDDQPDFSFDLEGVDDMVNTSAVSATSLHSATNLGEVSVDDSTAQVSGMDELMESAAGPEGLEAFANTSGPSPILATTGPIHRLAEAASFDLKRHQRGENRLDPS